VALSPVARPPAWPTAPAPKPLAAPSAADPRMAAQRAFFEAALAGKAQPPSRAARAAEAVRAVAQAQAAPSQTPRPGSIIDILV